MPKGDLRDPSEQTGMTMADLGERTVHVLFVLSILVVIGILVRFAVRPGDFRDAAAESSLNGAEVFHTVEGEMTVENADKERSFQRGGETFYQQCRIADGDIVFTKNGSGWTATWEGPRYPRAYRVPDSTKIIAGCHKGTTLRMANELDMFVQDATGKGNN